MSSNESKRYTIYFSGRVQGVGFRYNTRAIARRFAVSGYVRNCDDGRVEVVAEGEPAELDAFVREVREAFFNNIRDVRRDTQQPTGEFTGFDIRH